MAQYFENDPALESRPIQIQFEMNGRHFLLKSDQGVFSKEHLDTGTAILLETMLEKQQPAEDVLDLGCGIGVIGVVLASFWKAGVLGIDISKRASLLAEENYRNNHVEGRVLNQDGLEGIEEKFSCIVLNPPIRAGKDVIYSLFEQAAEHLKEDGVFWIVMRKQHGAQSAIKKLESLGLLVEKENRDRGFWVMKAFFPQK